MPDRGVPAPGTHGQEAPLHRGPARPTAENPPPWRRSNDVAERLVLKVPNGMGPVALGSSSTPATLSTEPKEVTRMHWGYGWGWGDWLAMSLMMVAFWALLIGGIVYVVRSLGRRHDDERPRTRTAADILEERFAKGEIDEEEFKNRRDALLRA
jgi:putative membrane protein